MLTQAASDSKKAQLTKLTVQKRIVTVSIVIFIGKLIAYFLTNSVGILTDALESTVNVITGIVSVYSISLALKPKDSNHPFGHGKAEMLSASLEGFLILIAGLIIIFEAAKRLFSPAEINELDTGIIIIGVAGIINYLLGLYSIRVGKKHNSIALVAGGKHLQSDTYSTIGLVIGLLLLYFTEIAWLDSAIAFIFGGIIIYTGYKILKETTSGLMDEADFKAIETITQILWKHRAPQWIEIHNFKIVRYGSYTHIDCDLTLPWYIHIKEAHEQTDLLRDILLNHYSDEADLTIHIDACTENMCSGCKVLECKHRKKPFEKEIFWNTTYITKRKPSFNQADYS